MKLEDVLAQFDSWAWQLSRGEVEYAPETVRTFVDQVREAVNVPVHGLHPADYREILLSLRMEMEHLGEEVAWLRRAQRRLRRKVGRLTGLTAEPIAELAGREVLADARFAVPVIYALVDPQAPAVIRYVGQAAQPVIRYAGHLTAGSRLVARWVAQLRAEDRLPAMVLLERCEAARLDEREAFWIRHFLEQGLADLNTAKPAQAKRA